MLEIIFFDATKYFLAFLLKDIKSKKCLIAQVNVFISLKTNLFSK